MAADPIFKPPSTLNRVFCRVRYRPWFWAGEFTSDWAWKHYSLWRRVLARLRKTPVRIVEIGSWEGRSALFFLKYLPYSSIVCIDTFQGTPEENYVYALLQDQLAGIEARFDRNLAPFRGRVEKIKSRSAPALQQLMADGRRFDLAYIDGGHRYEDVMADSIGVWSLLEPGGIVIWDDYEWAPDFAPEQRPKLAIDDFLAARAGDCRLLAKGHQVIVERLS
jgi:predicted O-methyltransferase YrrM